MINVFLAEMIGSMFLLVFGFAAIASDYLNKSHGNGSGWLMQSLSWGIGLSLGLFAATTIGSQGHVNPAVTLAFITAGILPATEAGPYLAGQVTGGMFAGLIVWLLYLPHWAATEDKDAKLACFAMSPGIRNIPANFVAEFLSFFIFAFGIFLISKVVFPVSVIAGTFATGLWLSAAIMATGGQTGCGYAIDLGTRIAHQMLPIAGKRDSDWGYAWVNLLAPGLAAVAAAFAATHLGLV